MQDYNMDKMTEQRKQSRSKFVQLPRTIKSPKSEKKVIPLVALAVTFMQHHYFTTRLIDVFCPWPLTRCAMK